MTLRHVSEEEFEAIFDARRSEGDASINIGDCSLVAPCFLIEFYAWQIERALLSPHGFDWIYLGGYGDQALRSILVTASTPVSIGWPLGYEPSYPDNELIQALERSTGQGE